MFHIFRLKLNTSVAWSHPLLFRGCFSTNIVDANQRMQNHFFAVACWGPFDYFCFRSLFCYAMRRNRNLQMHSAASAQAWGWEAGFPPLLAFLSLVNWLTQRCAHTSYICILSEVNIGVEGLKAGITRKFNKASKNISLPHFLLYWSFFFLKKGHSKAQELYMETFHTFIFSNLEWPSNYLCLHL